MLYRATQGVVDGRMTLGDLVMVNAFMIQLYIPLGFLGTLYREIKQSLTDLDKMFTVDGAGTRDCGPTRCVAAWMLDGEPTIRFEHVDFTYDSDKSAWPMHWRRAPSCTT
jgi:ABC-type transport system involved in Fe-S cluster assembly fused permease/ATPase subunit